MRKLCLALTLVAAAGCGGVGRTTLGNPGPARLQQRRAELFDPYPQESFSGESVGVRPRDYDKPPLNPTPRTPWGANALPR